MKDRVRAVIIENSKILLIKRTKKNSVYWVIPGGGVNEGEAKKEALRRECKEELGIKIMVGAVMSVINSKKPETEGQKEYFYLCNILDGILGSGQGPEFQRNSFYVGSYDIEWRDIKDLPKIDLKPEEIKNLIYKRYYKTYEQDRSNNK